MIHYEHYMTRSDGVRYAEAIEDYPEIQAIVDADLAEIRGVA